MKQEQEQSLQQILAWLNPFINQPQYRAKMNTLLQQTISNRALQQRADWLPGMQAEL